MFSFDTEVKLILNIIQEKPPKQKNYNTSLIGYTAWGFLRKFLKFDNLKIYIDKMFIEVCVLQPITLQK